MTKVPIYQKDLPWEYFFEEAGLASTRKDPFIVDAVILRYNLTFELF